MKLYFLFTGFGFHPPSLSAKAIWRIRVIQIGTMALAVWLHILFTGLSLTHAQQVSSNAVKIVIDGKQYGSMHEYRRERIKNVLIRALAADDLQAFTEEELFDIIKDVRKQQTTGVTTSETDKAPNSLPDPFRQNQKSNEEVVFDPSSSQLEEMLKDYLNEHKDVDPIIIDPDKVKSIVIEPKVEPKDTLLD